MQDFKLVGREMNLCMSSIKNFAELEAHLLIKVREGSELYIQYFLDHISETLKSKTEAPITKFYALFLLFRASELQNYAFYYLLGKSDQVTNVVFHYSQLDSTSTVPGNKKGIHIFSKTPTYHEAMIGANFWRLCQELVIYWYETTKSYKPRENFEVFQYIYNCTKKKCQLPKLYHFLEKDFDLSQEIATCDFSIKSPYLIRYQEKSEVIELPISPEINEEPMKSFSGSESSLSLDEDIIVIPTNNARNRHRTSTVVEPSILLNFQREAAAAVVTANSQTDIGSGPPKLSAAVRRSIFASKKNLSLPAHDPYSPKESWGGRGEPNFLISNHDDGVHEIFHSPLSKGLSSIEGTPTMSRYTGLLKEDVINLKGGNDESKTDGSEVKSIGSRRKMSMEEELAEIQHSINHSLLKANSLNPSLTNLKSGNEPKSAVGFHKLFDEDHAAKVRRASFTELGGSTEEMSTPKPQMRKSKFSILIHSEQKSDGGSGGLEAPPSVQNASVTSSPGKNYHFKRQSNLEVVARVNSLFQDFKPEPRRSSCMTNIDRRFSGAVRSKPEETTFDNNDTSLNLEADETSPKSIHHHLSPAPQIKDFTLRKADYQPRLFFDKLLVNGGSQSEMKQSEVDSPSPSFKVYTAGDLNQGKSASENSGKPVGFKYVNENKALREKLKEYEEKIRLLEKQVGNTNTKREF